MDTQKRILLVEDNDSLRNILKEKLEDEGFVILEAMNGEEGLKIAVDETPDLVVTDMVMFQMDGMTMISELRATNPWGEKVPIIALTNLNDSAGIEKAKKLGVTEYMVKSDSGLSEIVRKIKKILSRS